MQLISCSVVAQVIKMDSMMDITSILIAFLVLICMMFGAAAGYIYRLEKGVADIPGPSNDSFWQGCAPSAKIVYSKGTMQNYFYQLHLKYGKTYKIRIYNRMFVVSIDPDSVKELVVSGRHQKSWFFTVLVGKLFGSRLFGYKSILTETNIKQAYWKRAQLHSSFRKVCLKNVIPDFNTAVDPLMRKLMNLADGKTVITLLDEFTKTTLDVLWKIGFGIDRGCIESKSNPITSAMTVTLEGLACQMRNPFYMFNPKNWRSVLRTKQGLKSLRYIGDKLIGDRMLLVSNVDYERDDILSKILKLENDQNINKDDLLDEITTIIFAGTESTAGFLSFMVICLGQNPHCLNKLQEEVDSLVGEKSLIEFSDIHRLTYLDMVMKETLRMYPPVGGTIRTTGCDVTINGIKIPKGYDVYMSAYSAHRWEEFYEDASTFKPERFSLKSNNSLSTYSYFPFSLGCRNCIGKYYAEIEAKIIMTKLIQRFEFKLDPNQSFGFHEDLTLKPNGKAAVTLTQR